MHLAGDDKSSADDNYHPAGDGAKTSGAAQFVFPAGETVVFVVCCPAHLVVSLLVACDLPHARFSEQYAVDWA
jgi:hypothetical protein